MAIIASNIGKKTMVKQIWRLWSKLIIWTL